MTKRHFNILVRINKNYKCKRTQLPVDHDKFKLRENRPIQKSEVVVVLENKVIQFDIDFSIVQLLIESHRRNKDFN